MPKKGYKQTEEHKRKIKDSLKGKTHGFKKGNIPWIKGKKFNDMHSKKLSDAQKKAWSEGKYNEERNKKIKMRNDVELKLRKKYG